MQITKKLTEGNVYRNCLQYAIPLILSSILSSLYSTVDAVIAGKCIGELALGAVSAASSLESLLFSVMNGFAGGFSVYLSHLFGQRDHARIKRDTCATVFFIAAVGIMIGGFAILFRNPILDYLKVDPILRADSEMYFIIIMGGSVFTYVNRILGQVLPAMGVTSVSFYVSVGSSVLNIVGNLLTVMVFDMGVAGLAISTVVSTLCVTVVYGFMLRRAFRELPCEKVSFRFRFSYVSRAFRYTIPAAAQQLAFHGVGFLIAPSINGMGAAATAGYNVTNRLYSLSSLTIWNATSAIACYTAQCVGEGDCRKISRGLRAGFIMNSAMLIPVLIGFFCFAEPIVSIFFPAEFEGQAFEYALRYVRIYMPFLFIQMVDHLLHSYMRSLGRVSVVLWISLFGSAVRTVVTLMLVPYLHMDGVYLSQVISWGADTLVSVVLYLRLYRTEEQLQRIVDRIHSGNSGE